MVDGNQENDRVEFTGNRRRFLKAIGATSAGLALSSSAVTASTGGNSSGEAVVESVLGEQETPVTTSKIKSIQKKAIKKYDGGGEAVLLPEYPIPDGWFIAGYAVGIEDGVPSHMVQVAPEPQPAVQANGQTFRKLPALDRKHARINNFVEAFGSDQSSGSATAESNDITTTATSASLSNMDPSPSDEWDKKGSNFMEGEVFVENHGVIGHLSHYVELWKSLSEEQSDTNDYAVSQQMETIPGVDHADGHEWAYNYSSKVEAGFNNANLFPYNFLDRSPTGDQTSVFDTEVSVGVSSGGGEAILSTNYDVPYVSRNVTVDPGELIRYEYGYPDDPLKSGNEGYNNICEMDHLTLVRCAPIDADWDRVCTSDCTTTWEWNDNIGNGHRDDMGLYMTVSMGILT